MKVPKNATRAVLKLVNLKNYQVVSEPCTTVVRVAATVTPKFLIDDEHPRYLIPLRVGTEDQLKEVTEKLLKKDALPYSQVGKYFLTGALFKDTIDNEDDLPVKGEEVIATFDYVSGRLLCRGITLLPRNKLKVYDPEKYRETKSLFKQIISAK